MSFAALSRKSASLASNVAGNRARGMLRIGEADDSFEREAERAADEVMRGTGKLRWSLSAMSIGAPLQRKCACGGSGGGEGECDECHKKKMLQRKPAGAPVASEAPFIVQEVLHEPGQALDNSAREFFEARFGYDFSAVRVHADTKAAASARSVNALAYSVGNHLVFDAGRYSTATHEGRKLLAHELAHTIQQSGAGRSSRAAAQPGVGRHLGRVGQPRVQRAPNPISATDDFSAIIARLESIIRTGGPVPTDTRVIAAAIVEVEGYTGAKEIRAISAAATDVLGQSAGVHHAVSPATRTLSATKSIAGAGARREFPFSHVNDAEMKAFEEIASHLPENAKGSVHFLTMRVRQVGGQTVFEPIPACSGCTRATFEMGSFRGVNMVSHAATHPTGTLSLADDPDAVTPAESQAQAGKGGAAAEGGAKPGTASVRVGTQIEVKSAVKQPDGSTVSEVEYNFAENLEQLNHGAPAGAKFPSRMLIRVTQNAEGAITGVESLSGEPAALAEALARQTLTQGLAGEAGGAAAAGAGRLAVLSKGLKIGGWAAFLVITGYQLYKATPAQRPRVLAQAAGGVAGGALATFGVCNVALDLETAGWGILICGLIAGGAGGYAGSEAAGEVYDEATATELSRALHRLDSRSANDRVLFNILVGNLGYSADCIDAPFVQSYLSLIPQNLQDYEVVLLAGQLAKASGAVPAAASRGSHTSSSDQSHTTPGFPSFAKKKSTVCPGCHGRSQAELQPNLPGFDQKEFDAIMAAPTCREVLNGGLDALRAAIRQLPARQPAAQSAVQHPPASTKTEAQVSPGTHQTPPDVHLDTTPHGFPTLEEQRGKTPCPSCHDSGQSSFGSHLGTKPLTEQELKALGWLQEQK